jgi:hypothetical protein
MAFASALKRKEIADWWVNREAFATTLLALAIDEFGTECFEWEPETIRLEISDLYNVEIPGVNMDKLLGLMTAMSTDLFYRSVETFTHVANALNGSEANFQLWDPVEADEAAWAISEIYLNDPPPRGKTLTELYSEDVRRYLGVILEEEAIITPPDLLEIAIVSPSFKGSEATFADDPALFQGLYRLSQAKSKGIAEYVSRRMDALSQQLSDIPLQNRDEERWGAFLKRQARPSPS